MVSVNESYTIGEMADYLKIPASTLRYYDKPGLLPFVNRNAAGIRVPERKDYDWLMIIECLKKTGMT
ncbi:MAG: MerR family DNA-binding transcriptional regulator [Bulleidia sp.]